MSFAVGSLVQARGRDWVVLPESQGHDDLLVVRPLVGGDDEITGIYLPLEPVAPARFELPDPAGDLGNHRSGALLREAVRLGFRSAAGPFRALGAIAVEPRPYQLVPLLMALRLDPVRLLVADDVGVGKSIEAALVLRELLDRGEIETSVVLAPPHVAEQWHRLLVEQFHVDAVLLLPGTAARLDRQAGLGPHRSVFDHFPHVVVSMDYIKQDHRRHELLRAKPDLVLVDEAHTCAAQGVGRAAQRRHALLRDLAAAAERHLLLVTATPHSGNEEAFRSLLGLLDPAFAELPDDLGGEANRPHRERLARHFVQRRRGDLAGYLGIDTPFPERQEAQEHYSLSPAYRRFFERVLAYCRESVIGDDENQHRRRVRWWSALALLRALSSSPEAAAATLRNRAAAADTETVEEADDVGRRTVLDQDVETLEGNDVVPGSRLEEDDGDDGDDGGDRRRLQRMAREVLELAGDADAKLGRARELVRQLLDDGFAPIVFCRFIPTVAYVAAELRRRFGAGVTVEAITGQLPPEERERRVAALGQSPRRVLVCTDCLSEGINLQEHFDAVLHYDLSWNPTRHEQREGRVDRYGQPEPVVRTVMLHGENNPVDGIVLQVLLRKHFKIRETLGVTVPVPMDTNAVVEAIFEGLLMREDAGSKQLSFEFLEEQQRALDAQWDAAAEREKKSRTVYAQHGLRYDDAVRHELDAARHAIGGADAVERFVRESLQAFGTAVGDRNGTLAVELESAPREVRDALVPAGEKPGTLRAVFAPPAPSGAEVLTRTHPLVTALAERVWARALSPHGDQAPARRCAVIRTAAVDRRTTLLLLRLRFHIVTQRRGEERPLLAEEAQLAAFRGSPQNAEWLPPGDVEALLAAAPSGNVPGDAARHHLARVVDRFDAVRPRLDEIAAARGQELLDAHRRVRRVTREGLRSLRVEPLPPVDVLGLFVYLPDLPEDGG